ASTSSSGTLPSNTIANPRSYLKAVTTRSGVSYDGPQIPPSTSFLPKVVENEPKATKDTVHPTNNGSTEDVQPYVVQSKSPILTSKPVNSSISKPVAYPVSASRPNLRPSIPYPSRMQDQKLRDKANNQHEKFFQIFKDLNFNISFADALILMSKFGPSIKSLLTNKDKLFELARTPLNEHCLAVLLKKLPKKLGDPGKFRIPCDFPKKAECLALADLDASNNLIPLFVWNKLSFPDFLLHIERALIDVFEGELSLHVGKEAITFNLDQNSRYSTNYSDMTAKRIDVIDMSCEEYSQEFWGFSNSYLNPHGDILLLEAFLNDDPSLCPPNQGSYLPEVHKELKICKAKSDKYVFLEGELKDLPSHLKYAFLKGENRSSWLDKLDDALWAFRTAYKTPIGCTLYKLVYGKACHLPIELEHKAYWALKHTNFDLKITEGIPDNMCDVPLYDNSLPLDVSKDQFEDFFDSNDSSTSIDEDSFSIDNIEYVEASPPDYELVSSEVMEIVIREVGGIDDDILLTIKDDILREKLLNVNLLIANIEALKDNPTLSSDFMTKSSSTSFNSLLEETNTFDNSLPELETFCFDLEEISSGSTTTCFDISLPEYEAFYDDHVKEISSGSTTTCFDISLPEYEAFYDDHVKEISSGSTTTLYDSSLYDSFIFDLLINPFPPASRSDFYEFADELAHIISPPEYDCFCFKNEPNSRDFTMDVVEDIFPTREPIVHNALPTHLPFQLN
nr:reverse transcriptase domain-containing protein [Tanacetum cinerariifolium]